MRKATGLRGGFTREDLAALITFDPKGGKRVDTDSLRRSCRSLQQIPRSKIEIMRKKGKVACYPAGYPIFTEGEPCEMLIYVLRGFVNVYCGGQKYDHQKSSMSGGRPYYGPVVACMGEGSSFGELSLFTAPALRAVTIVAKDQCECVLLDKKHFEQAEPLGRDSIELTPELQHILTQPAEQRTPADVDDLLEAIAHHSFFAHLPEYAQRALAQRMTREAYKSGEVVTRQGQEASKMLLLTDGTVSLHVLEKQLVAKEKDPSLDPFLSQPQSEARELEEEEEEREEMEMERRMPAATTPRGRDRVSMVALDEKVQLMQAHLHMEGALYPDHLRVAEDPDLAVKLLK
ncbi:hypothetical protein CYMTET_21599, partial [Cymbomonas tetramitiformis]